MTLLSYPIHTIILDYSLGKITLKECKKRITGNYNKSNRPEMDLEAMDSTYQTPLAFAIQLRLSDVAVWLLECRSVNRNTIMWNNPDERFAEDRTPIAVFFG